MRYMKCSQCSGQRSLIMTALGGSQLSGAGSDKCLYWSNSSAVSWAYKKPNMIM